jgi:hypothetical protein
MADVALLEIKLRSKLLLDRARLEPDQDKQELVRSTGQSLRGFFIFDPGPPPAIAH